MDYIVDVQGFKLPTNEFIIKELAILTLNKNCQNPYKFIFQPPCEWKHITSHYKRINRWLENNVHCIMWSSGYVPYTLHQIIMKNIFKNATKIYVKGLEKKMWLKKFVKPSTQIIDMMDINCPSLQTLIHKSCNITPCCDHRNVIKISTIQCAVRNVKLLSHWLLKKKYFN